MSFNLWPRYDLHAVKQQNGVYAIRSGKAVKQNFIPIVCLKATVFRFVQLKA